MKILIETNDKLKKEGRWDIDYHLPPIGIRSFPQKILKPVITCADTVKLKKDPTKQPEQFFQYIDISSIDVDTGIIVRPQELTGEEAPSRARKLVRAYDIIISTCRPTRGAIAVVPEELHGQICSTGFSVIRVKEEVNPFYVHFALRLPSTLEQVRKWSTGSSYPAILDDDVMKTLIPLPDVDIQDQIAKDIRTAFYERQRVIDAANKSWDTSIYNVINRLTNSKESRENIADICEHLPEPIYTAKQIQERIRELPPLTSVVSEENDAQLLFDDE